MLVSGRGVPRLRDARSAPSSGSTPRRMTPGTAVKYDKLFVRHWDTWSDGRRSQLVLDCARRLGRRRAQRRSISRRASMATCRASPSAAAKTMRSARTGSRWRFRCAPCRWASPGPPTSTSIVVPAARRHATQSHRRQSRLRTNSRPFLPTARRWRTREERPGFESDRLHLVLIDLKSGAKRPLTQNWDRSIGSYQLVAGRQDAVRDGRPSGPASPVGDRRRDRPCGRHHRRRRRRGIQRRAEGGVLHR